MHSIEKTAFALLFLFLASCEPKELGAEGKNRGAISPEFVYQSGETNFVNLSAKMHRTNELGGPIYVDFKLQNNRREAVWLNHNHDAGDIWMKLTTNRLEVVPLTDLGKLYDMGDPYEFNRNMPKSLKPGGTMTWRYNLCDYFQITKPGQYRLLVIRTVDGTETDPADGGDDQEVDVGPIRFGVTNK